MSDGRPFALHITWTCYGTWLPGDERGSVSNQLLPEGGFRVKQNNPGTPVLAGDSYTRQRAMKLQKGETVFLTAAEALCVAEELVNAARDRGWRILRGAVMANHVHVVVTDCPDDGPAVRRILKGVSQAKLRERTGRGQRCWTAGGSDRYKHDQAAIDAAVRYAAKQERMLAQIVDMIASPA
jgi:REP element-mobilizing transposase RayT